MFSARVIGGVLVLVLASGGVGYAQPLPPAADPAPPSIRFDKDREYMYRIKDFTPLRVEEARTDHDAFCDLALHAHRFRAADLLAAARKDLSYSNMMAADDRYREDARFELVRIDGRLKRLKRIGSYDRLKAAGISDVLEAWVFPHDGANPVCVMLTQPPEGIEPADDISPGKPVSTCGYFFKVIEYQSSEPHPKKKDQTLYRRAPLLIGKTLVADTTVPPDDTGGEVVVRLLPAVAVGGVLLVLLLGALTYWLRKTDAGTRAYTARRGRNPFADSPSPADDT